MIIIYFQFKKSIVRSIKFKEGITDSRPTKRDTVRINAIGRLENGTQFEELHDLVFTVGDGESIETSYPWS
ncbi:hypothetical protein Avbf_06187 [Armadillidium vulgare]|nr:hypothetical protein Avbf_06187 [Armadillidium vulgare]